MNVKIVQGVPLTLAVACTGIVVQTYRFVMIKPNGEHTEITGSNPEVTTADAHQHTLAPPIPPGTAIKGVLSYTDTNGAAPFSDEVHLEQSGATIPSSVDAKPNQTTSTGGVAARFVEYVIQ